jgi:hypothetical protein
MDIDRLGAILGLAAFFGLAVLGLLVIQQARDLRRLRRWAGQAPERAIEAAETRGEDIPAPKHNRVMRALISFGAAVHDLLARAWAALGRGFEALDRRSPVDLRILAGILAVAAIAAAAVLTSGFGFFGDDTAKKGKGGRETLPPGKIEVAVLNGTAASGVAAVPGLATEVSPDVKKAGYKLGPVGDTDTAFIETVVMYEPGEKAAARQVARDLEKTLGETPVQEIIAEVSELAQGADVAVVLGADDAELPGAETGADPTTITPAPEPGATTLPEADPIE